MKFLAIVGALALAGALAVPVSAVPYVPPPWHMNYDSLQPSSNPGAPNWCMNEDDAEFTYWSGSFSGTSSVSTTQPLCDPAVDYSAGMYWSPGNVALAIDARITGTATVYITSPTGIRYDGTETSATQLNGKDHLVLRRYQVCVWLGQWTGHGHWTFTISGTWTDAHYYTYAANVDPANCAPDSTFRISP